VIFILAPSDTPAAENNLGIRQAKPTGLDQPRWPQNNTATKPDPNPQPNAPIRFSNTNKSTPAQTGESTRRAQPVVKPITLIAAIVAGAAGVRVKLAPLPPTQCLQLKGVVLVALGGDLEHLVDCQLQPILVAHFGDQRLAKLVLTGNIEHPTDAGTCRRPILPLLLGSSLGRAHFNASQSQQQPALDFAETT
jgi:hypothetical protein